MSRYGWLSFLLKCSLSQCSLLLNILQVFNTYSVSLQKWSHMKNVNFMLGCPPCPIQTHLVDFQSVLWVFDITYIHRREKHTFTGKWPFVWLWPNNSPTVYSFAPRVAKNWVQISSCRSEVRGQGQELLQINFNQGDSGLDWHGGRLVCARQVFRAHTSF